MKFKGFNDIREDEPVELEQQLSPQQKIQKIYEEKQRKKEEERRLRLQKDTVDNSAISVEKSTILDVSLCDPAGPCVESTHDTMAAHVPLAAPKPLSSHDRPITHDTIGPHVPLRTPVPVRTPDSLLPHVPGIAHVPQPTHDPLLAYDLSSTHDTSPTHDVAVTHDLQTTHDSMAARQEVAPIQDKTDKADLRVGSTHIPSLTHVPLDTHNVFNSSGVQSTHVPPITHNRLPTHDTKKPKNTAPRLVRLSRNKAVYPEASPVHIKYNYAYRDRDLIKYMHEMTGDEWKVYCYLLSLTHEKWEGETHCWTSQYVVAEETGIGTRKTAGLVLESLEARGFIQRTFTGNRAIKLSQYRVFLPCETEGYQGKTEISYTPRNPKT